MVRIASAPKPPRFNRQTCSLFLREYAETNATGAFFNSFVAAVANLANKIAGAVPRLTATQYRLYLM